MPWIFYAKMPVILHVDLAEKKHTDILPTLHPSMLNI
jgi:hypothetical protein